MLAIRGRSIACWLLRFFSDLVLQLCRYVNIFSDENFHFRSRGWLL
jgi:hypothetical protein